MGSGVEYCGACLNRVREVIGGYCGTWPEGVRVVMGVLRYMARWGLTGDRGTELHG